MTRILTGQTFNVTRINLDSHSHTIGSIHVSVHEAYDNEEIETHLYTVFQHGVESESDFVKYRHIPDLQDLFEAIQKNPGARGYIHRTQEPT